MSETLQHIVSQQPRLIHFNLPDMADERAMRAGCMPAKCVDHGAIGREAKSISARRPQGMTISALPRGRSGRS